MSPGPRGAEAHEWVPASVPAAADYGTIAMTAGAVTDPSGVEYYFENVTKGTNSGWQGSSTWIEDEAQPGRRTSPSLDLGRGTT